MNEEVTFSILYHDLLDKFVWVTWIDSMSRDGWNSLESGDHLKPLPEIQSVGKLVADEKEFVVIVGDHYETDYNRSMRIPKGCIKNIQALSIN